MRTAIVAYVPVIHSGYIKFFEKYPNTTLYVLGEEFISEFPRLERDIRRLGPEEAKKAVEALGIFSEVKILNKKDLPLKEKVIIMPDEDVMRNLMKEWVPGSSHATKFEEIFLRWDRNIPTKEIAPTPDRKISKSEFDREVISVAERESKKSPDWWRQVGVVVVKDGKVLFQTHNKHLPNERILGYQGDPRSNFDAGEHIEISTVLHGEAGIIAEAARKGISLEGTSIYVTVFPCPNCAKLIAASGIKKVFYAKGYSLLDAEDIFESFDVELIKVE